MLTNDQLETRISHIEDKQIELAHSFSEKPAKDIWDKLQATAPIISGLLMFGMAGYFTWSYNQQQLRLQEIQTIEKFIPHLMSDERSKKAAILAISSLTNTEFAARFASIFASPGTVSALKSIATTGNTKERTIATEALTKALDNIATRYSLENKLNQAEIADKSAPEDRTLGIDNPDIPHNLDILAELYKTQGKLGEAERVLKQSLKLRQEIYGPDEPSVSETRKNLAEIYALAGKAAEADSIYSRAKTIDQVQTHRSASQSAGEIESNGNTSPERTPAKELDKEPS